MKQSSEAEISSKSQYIGTQLCKIHGSILKLDDRGIRIDGPKYNKTGGYSQGITIEI